MNAALQAHEAEAMLSDQAHEVYKKEIEPYLELLYAQLERVKEKSIMLSKDDEYVAETLEQINCLVNEVF